MLAAIIAFLKSLPATIVTFLTRPAPPAVGPTSTPTDVVPVLAKLILSQTESLGPMPGTGGVIHAVDAAQAANVAQLIVAASKTSGVRVSLIASLIRGESDFDAAAKDPNDQLNTPGDTPAQEAQHADLGIEQEDVSTAEGNPQFKGLTLAQLEAKLMDPAYGVNFVALTLASNLGWAVKCFAADPTLASRVPNGDHEVLACQAYNDGPTGALAQANTPGGNGNWSYGTGVVNRAAGWASLLDV